MPREPLFLSILVALSLSAPALGAQRDWTGLAERLTGESDGVRAQALSALSKDRDLENELKQEILSQGPRRFLAYDVISALKLGALLEDLLSCSERDQSGFAYHAVNALVVAANRERIAAIYLSRAVASRTSDASRMVLLDSLGRLGHALKVSDLEKLLRSPSPELRSAALYHVRHFLVHWSHEDFLPLVGKALLSSDRALRMQALKLVTELSPVLWRRARPLLQSCASDPDEEIRGACGKASSR